MPLVWRHWSSHFGTSVLIFSLLFLEGLGLLGLLRDLPHGSTTDHPLGCLYFSLLSSDLSAHRARFLVQWLLCRYHCPAKIVHWCIDSIFSFHCLLGPSSLALAFARGVSRGGV